MKIFLAILSLTFFIACNNISKVDIIILPPENVQIHTIKLVDSWGSVTLSLPSRYDTNFSWTHHSDCGPSCDKIKYRFQPKSLPVHKETGWMWFDLKDSVESFTIINSGYLYPSRSDCDNACFLGIHQAQKDHILNDPTTYKIKLDTIEKIGNHYFSIFMIDLFDSVKSQYSKKLLAGTRIKGNRVEFNFELLTKQKDSLEDNFLKTSLYSLRTVTIND